ncbi:HAD family hydrolase [Amphibacillus sp. Q70]|uniref:HAD family hydrolase n=1 Tax=Amphibacillus sp. Q70 TaxID=3453416 RepID=UPI003F85CA71
MQSIIFDFNGTLFSDTALHEQAWQQFIQELVDRKFTEEEFHQIHGRTNHLIIEGVLGKTITKAEGEELSERKEAIYRDLVLKENQMQLIAGATDYFAFLKDNQQLMNIATASPKTNLDFYFDVFQLDRWFDYKQVVYNDGSLASKPAPDYYIQAALNVGANPKQMIIFEDSLIGLQGARHAQAKQIIAVATAGNHEELNKTGLVDFVIDDFTDSRIQQMI